MQALSKTILKLENVAADATDHLNSFLCYPMMDQIEDGYPGLANLGWRIHEYEHLERPVYLAPPARSRGRE